MHSLTNEFNHTVFVCHLADSVGHVGSLDSYRSAFYESNAWPQYRKLLIPISGYTSLTYIRCLSWELHGIDLNFEKKCYCDF